MNDRTDSTTPPPAPDGQKPWVAAGLDIFDLYREAPQPRELAAQTTAGAILSGLSIVFPQSSAIMPGVFFGLAFILPWCRLGGVSRGLTTVSVLLAPVGYYLAVYCYFQPASRAWAGLAGTSVLLLPLIVFGPMPMRGGALAGCVAGWLAGMALAPLFVTMWLIPGVIGWQLVTALAMERGRRAVAGWMATASVEASARRGSADEKC